ncbi:glycosyltransferase family 2 protein [Candidatus Woesearchaeota archaeon]|nr:glycosyltransferase family 2 protein [Candidatus Woesearchaeota archaeon]
MNLFVSIILWISYILSLYFSIFLLLVYFDQKKLFRKEKTETNLISYPFVSILVPAYNEEKTIEKTLRSIDQLEYPKEKIEVIIINDGSKDHTEEVIQNVIRGKPEYNLLSHQNRGKAASLNRALALAKGEFFACLDADSFVHPLTLRKMVALYQKENDPSVAIITPAMKVADPKTILQKIQWLEYLVMILFSRLTSTLHSLYVAPGPFSIYRTEIIRSLGGFDEKNITEDQEIAYRVQLRQYKIKQCFDGYVYTTAPAKLRPFYRQRRRWYLGSVICLHQYREMIANKRYGDFGLMQMVKNTLGYFLAVAGITISLYYIFLPLMRVFGRMSAINFDLINYAVSFKSNVNIFTFLLMDFKLLFLVLLLFIIGFIFFYAAHKNAEERISKFGWLPIIPYFAGYYLLKGTILLISLGQFSRGKKMKW